MDETLRVVARSGGKDFGLEKFERLVDQRVVFEGGHRVGRRLGFGLGGRDFFDGQAGALFRV